MSDILIQIVDENDQPVGAATGSEAWTNGLIHRIARIMVEDLRGRVLLQKRSSNSTLYPSCWDNSAAGHVDEGESYEIAANREASEEIGLKNVKLEAIGYYRSSDHYQNKILNRFNKVYRVVIDPDTIFKVDPGEVSEVRWFTIDEVKKLIADHPDQVTDGILQVFENFYK